MWGDDDNWLAYTGSKPSVVDGRARLARQRWSYYGGILCAERLETSGRVQVVVARGIRFLPTNRQLQRTHFGHSSPARTQRRRRPRVESVYSRSCSTTVVLAAARQFTKRCLTLVACMDPVSNAITSTTNGRGRRRPGQTPWGLQRKSCVCGSNFLLDEDAQGLSSRTG